MSTPLHTSKLRSSALPPILVAWTEEQSSIPRSGADKPTLLAADPTQPRRSAETWKPAEDPLLASSSRR